MELGDSLQIKVLGPGCVRCLAVEQMTAAALVDFVDRYPSVKADLLHIEDPDQIREFRILGTPGLVINDKVVCAGRTPSKKEIMEWFAEATK